MINPLPKNKKQAERVILEIFKKRKIANERYMRKLLYREYTNSCRKTEYLFISYNRNIVKTSN
ncbi:MAG: hypothetical protein NZ891_06135 [bacterium]|nr:hypothetical protein [bacterium]MDW8164302.1 hypothetical protein [Candidatus Omnitrophota bacterium]